MNRADCQKLAQERIADVKALLAAKRWALAYYVAGYAVECALKACVLVRVAGETEVIFSEKRFSERCWTHNLEQLFDCAGLKAAFEADLAADPLLKENWVIVREWSESSRYDPATKDEAVDLYNGITDKRHGVLTWVKRFW